MKHGLRWRATLAVFVALVSTAPDSAGAQESASGTRPMGLGDAYTAIATGPAGFYHNPAGIPMLTTYAAGMNYEYHGDYSILNPAAVDSVTNRKLTAGLGYSYLLPHGGDGAPSGHDIRAALAVPAIQKQFSVGVGGRYVIFKRNQVEYARGFTLDGGVVARFGDNIQAGIAGKNLIDVCNRPVRCRGVTPRTLAAGFGYGRSTAYQITADFEVDLNSEEDAINYGYQAGGEYLIAGEVPVRLGYQGHTLDGSNHVTGGVGYRSKRAGFDAGADVNVNDPSEFLLSASIVVYFTPSSSQSSMGRGSLLE